MGPALGAVFLGLLSEILLLKFRYFYMLSLGLVLILVVLLLPTGLAGLLRRCRAWSTDRVREGGDGECRGRDR